MRVVYVSTDEGVPTFGTKGSSVHVQAMLNQFLDRGDVPGRPRRPTSPGSGCTCCRVRRGSTRAILPDARPPPGLATPRSP